MKESTDRLKHLYGPPASTEQIKLYFDTLLRTYIELSEKHPPDTLKKFGWYSKRPLEFIFCADNTTVCFTLIGNSDKEGSEQVANANEMTSCLQNGFTFITSSTSFNGQKLYSIDSAIREAISRHKLELKDIEIPTIKNNLEVTGKELEKPKPNINIIRNQHKAICQSVRQLSYAETQIDNEQNHDSISSFRQSNICPLIDDYVNRLVSVETSYKDLNHDINLIKENMDVFKDNTNESINLLRGNKSFKDSRRANAWIVAGIVLSFLLGVGNIIYHILSKSGSTGSG